MRNRFYAVLTVIVGVALLVGGLITLMDDSPVDTVVEPATGLAPDGQESDPANTGWLLIEGGALAVVGGAAWAYTQFARRRAEQRGQEPTGWSEPQ
ncbi:hypothetical protein SAMN05216266_1277 [Amycolatopsis marina]|uniref:Uncharacterized protein n=1 Tax=Amycolatopsis marina TaxID=490629 RepID=A0A1I1CK09_9PSEU|nr:hypothetical protein [Amycolatopsis marina]SFB60980.1 hypothetical protein SAMN05216266_1277 [Amycolatopsis marina]